MFSSSCPVPPFLGLRELSTSWLIVVCASAPIWPRARATPIRTAVSSSRRPLESPWTASSTYRPRGICPRATAASVLTLGSSSLRQSRAISREGTAILGSGWICPRAQAAFRRTSASSSRTASRKIDSALGDDGSTTRMSGPNRPRAQAALDLTFGSSSLFMMAAPSVETVSEKFEVPDFACRPIFPIAQTAAPRTFGSS